MCDIVGMCNANHAPEFIAKKHIIAKTKKNVCVNSNCSLNPRIAKTSFKKPCRSSPRQVAAPPASRDVAPAVDPPSRCARCAPVGAVEDKPVDEWPSDLDGRCACNVHMASTWMDRKPSAVLDRKPHHLGHLIVFPGWSCLS